PHVAMRRRERARRLRLSADIDARTRAERIGGTQLVIIDTEVVAAMRDGFAAQQGFDDGDPLAAIRIALVVLGKADARAFELRTIPRVHEVDREAPAADVLDLLSHLREHDRMI